MRKVLITLLVLPFFLQAQDSHLFKADGKDVVWTKEYKKYCTKEAFISWLNANSIGGQIHQISDNEIGFFLVGFDFRDEDYTLPYSIADKKFTGRGKATFNGNTYRVDVSEIITIQKFNNLPYGKKGDKIPLRKYYSFKKQKFKSTYQNAPPVISARMEEMFEVKED